MLITNTSSIGDLSEVFLFKKLIQVNFVYRIPSIMAGGIFGEYRTLFKAP